MSVYLVAMMTIHDAETYRKYTDRTPELFARHGARFLTRGGAIESLEGEAYDGRMVIVEFPSREAVDAWRADPEYQEAAQFRLASSTMHWMLVQDGVPADGAAPDPRL
jgi:uncharacterized protein (DUF1330 family)